MQRKDFKRCCWKLLLIDKQVVTQKSVKIVLIEFSFFTKNHHIFERSTPKRYNYVQCKFQINRSAARPSAASGMVWCYGHLFF